MAEPLFEASESYEAMLHRGVYLSGEHGRFFIEGRLRDLVAHLPAAFSPRRILGFGCGTGETALRLTELFADAVVVGVDTAAAAVARARATAGGPRLRFELVQELPRELSFDLCYSNGVFHHVAPPERVPACEWIRDRLVPGGLCAVFENNPWNLATHLVMARIPFDRGAVMLSLFELRRVLRRAGLEVSPRARTLFYFPSALSWLRPLEPALARLPLGAQYWLLACKPAPGDERERPWR